MPRTTLRFLFVVVATMIAFAPVLSSGWVNWDDPGTFLEHDAWRGLGAEQLAWMWSQAHMGHYTPLSWMTLAVDHRIWGLDAVGYHLTNLVLHGLSAGLFFLVLQRLLPKGAWAPALLGALLYGVHPLRVESVAWITERRDVLSMLLFQGCLLAWLRHAADEGRRWFFVALGLHALSLASKAHAITLPVVLLILDVWLGRKGWGRLVLEKLPFVGLAAVFAGLAIWAQSEGGALVGGHLSLGDRVEMALYGSAFYPGKMLVPQGLTPLYEWDGAELGTLRNIAVLLGITAICAATWKRTRAPMVAWALYLVLLSPVSGIAQSGPQLVADRYSYFSCLPLAALVAAGLVARRRLQVLGAAVMLFLGVLCFQQTKVWEDSMSLWTHAHQLDPDNEIVLAQLAQAHVESGDYEGAIPHLEEALRSGPPRSQTIFLLGVAYGNTGRPDKARHAWTQISPDAPEYVQAQSFLEQL